jgi:hypothetical protein
MPTKRNSSASRRRERRWWAGRSADKQQCDKPAVLSESKTEDGRRAFSLTRGTSLLLHYAITQSQKGRLRKRGYSGNEIAEMNPADAHPNSWTSHETPGMAYSRRLTFRGGSATAGQFDPWGIVAVRNEGITVSLVLRLGVALVQLRHGSLRAIKSSP